MTPFAKGFTQAIATFIGGIILVALIVPPFTHFYVQYVMWWHQ
jgi:hypothetical protein